MSAQRSAIRLLLIEDDVMVAARIRLRLREDDFVVDWVQDGTAAEQALQSASYSVVLLDLGLPRKECLAILETRYGRSDPVPLVVLEAQENAVDLDELAARIRAAVRRQHGEREDRMFALPFSWR